MLDFHQARLMRLATKLHHQSSDDFEDQETIDSLFSTLDELNVLHQQMVSTLRSKAQRLREGESVEAVLLARRYSG